jgi:streptogramin lyase
MVRSGRLGRRVFLVSSVSALLFGLTAGVADASGAGKISSYKAPSINGPGAIAAGPDGALWFTNEFAPGSIGRITTAGVVKSYTSPTLDNPDGITVGKDHDLWFTNFSNDSIGRITTAGKVTNYPSPSTGYIDDPEGITLGSDGDLWFVNRANDTDQWSVGRITETGVVWFTDEGTDTIDRITTLVTPEVTKFSPTEAEPGVPVTITGVNLSTATAVAFNGTKATIVSATASQVIASVPAGATTGPITVTTPAGTATSSTAFTVG